MILSVDNSLDLPAAVDTQIGRRDAMTTRHTTGLHWQLPGGAVAYECVAEHCQEIATIVLRGPKGYEWSLCTDDWQLLNRRALGLMEIVRMLERPTCFRRDCHDEAVVVMEDLDQTPLPVCQQHWDDLSWVTPRDIDNMPLLGGVRGPGWPS